DRELHEVDLAQGDSAAGFRRMWEDYARGILENVSTRQTGQDGRRAVEIVNAAYRSNQTGRTVDLPLAGLGPQLAQHLTELAALLGVVARQHAGVGGHAEVLDAEVQVVLGLARVGDLGARPDAHLERGLDRVLPRLDDLVAGPLAGLADAHRVIGRAEL